MQSRTTTTVFVVAAIILFFSGFFMVRFPEEATHPVPGILAVLLIALPSFIGVVHWLGARRGAVLLGSLAVFAYAIEFIGVTTGFPYSPFSYGNALGPKLLGVLPFVLPFAYVPLVLGAVFLWWPLRQRAEFFIPVVALSLTVFDLVLDPGAVALGHWTFAWGGAYYGVPFFNFLGWLLSGSFAAILALLLTRHERPPPRALVSSAVLMFIFWTGIALWFELWVPLVIALIVLGLGIVYVRTSFFRK